MSLIFDLKPNTTDMEYLPYTYFVKLLKRLPKTRGLYNWFVITVRIVIRDPIIKKEKKWYN